MLRLMFFVGFGNCGAVFLISVFASSSNSSNPEL
jgi:hypothetical protein